MLATSTNKFQVWFVLNTNLTDSFTFQNRCGWFYVHLLLICKVSYQSLLCMTNLHVSPDMSSLGSILSERQFPYYSWSGRWGFNMPLYVLALTHHREKSSELLILFISAHWQINFNLVLHLYTYYSCLYIPWMFYLFRSYVMRHFIYCIYSTVFILYIWDWRSSQIRNAVYLWNIIWPCESLQVCFVNS